tara:strand:- start:181 stop:990 length:810 start_codon:yes stop_codon:yes gene_type:complete
VKGRAAILPLLLAGCAAPHTHVAGDGPPTIVSLNPCADAILAEVAAPGQLLAISHYSHDPASASMPQAQAHRFPATSGTVEEVLALGPDMVVGDMFLSPTVRAAYEREGIAVVTLPIAEDVPQSLAQVRTIADAIGQSENGEALVGEIEAAMTSSPQHGGEVPTLLWQAGGIVPGEATLAMQLLNHAGFASQSAARGLGQGAYLPLEEVLAEPPALVVAAGEERMLTHPALRALDGTHYRSLDATLLFCGGPTIPRLLARLGEIRSSLE